MYFTCPPNPSPLITSIHLLCIYQSVSTSLYLQFQFNFVFRFHVLVISLSLLGWPELELEKAWARGVRMLHVTSEGWLELGAWDLVGCS